MLRPGTYDRSSGSWRVGYRTAAGPFHFVVPAKEPVKDSLFCVDVILFARAKGGSGCRVVHGCWRRTDRSCLGIWSIWRLCCRPIIAPGLCGGLSKRLELAPFYEAIGSREGEAGRPAADPKVLLALWLYATLEGVGAARELDRLVRRDVAYRWLAGGVPVNYHGLSDFRVGWSEALDRLRSE